MKTVLQRIEDKLKALQPEHLEVFNESAGHNVPRGSETHFKVVVVSGSFQEFSRVARHQLINQILAEELRGPIHALSIQSLTPSEWLERDGYIAESPHCAGSNISSTL